MSESLRIIFAGTPDFAAFHLDALINTKHQIVGVFTKPDQPTGRGNRLKSSPVKELAKKYGLPLFQPNSLHEFDSKHIIAKLNADIMIVVAYGLIFPKNVLELPRLGCINVHGSLLPRWRGAAPIQRALCAGDDYTGITIIQMDSGLDTGVILHKVPCKIQPNDTSASLYKKLAQIGVNALLFTLIKITLGNIVVETQDNTLATYAYKISKEEARIDWYLSAVQLERCIRAFNPWPISYFSLSGHLIKVFNASVDHEQTSLSSPGTILAIDKTGIHINTSKGILVLTQLQLAGKRIMSAKDFLNSRYKWFIPGTVLE